MIKFPKKVIYVTAGAGVALAVLIILFFGNIGIISVLSFFEKPDPYIGKIVLFYGNGCEQCQKVDDFIKTNKVKTKVSFEEVEVFDNRDNAKILIHKAKFCGLSEKDLGVPFLWDDQFGKCVYGYADVIKFFQEKLKKVLKP